MDTCSRIQIWQKSYRLVSINLKIKSCLQRVGRDVSVYVCACWRLVFECVFLSITGRTLIPLRLSQNSLQKDRGHLRWMLQETDSGTKLHTITYSVSTLDPHGNAVVELQACDVAQPEHDAGPV